MGDRMKLPAAAYSAEVVISAMKVGSHEESARNGLALLNGEKTWRRPRRSANGSDMNQPNGPSFAGDTERN